jgi:hypothetical protein
MENFNKNNPFIIIAKKVYDNIIDLTQDFSKSCIKSSIIVLILYIIIIPFYAYNMFINIGYIFSISVMIGLLMLNMFMIYKYKLRIDYFINSSTTMKEFSRLSELEVNDILTLNNEDVLKCVHGLYELRGELKATTKFYKNYFIANICTHISFLIGIIIILFN